VTGTLLPSASLTRPGASDKQGGAPEVVPN
jgi:hypothetical protein